MLNFKQYLQEAKVNFAPWHDVKNIDWRQFELNKITQNKDGTFSSTDKYVSTGSAFSLRATQFPVQFKTVRSFSVGGYITSLWGFPFKVRDNAWISCPDLEHIDHVTTTINGSLDLTLPKLKSIEPGITCHTLCIRDIGEMKLKDVLKKINYTHGVELAENYLFKHRNILCLMQLPKNISIHFPHFGDTITPDQYWKEAKRVLDIINNTREKNGGILDCQEALIDAGLEDYAQF